MVFNFGADAFDESILYCSDENGMEIRITIEEKVEIIVKKYQIFVGSTYNDLIEERQTAIRANHAVSPFGISGRGFAIGRWI